MEQQSQDNLQELMLESQHTKSTETNALLGMILEKVAEKDNLPELQLELLGKISKKLEEPITVELQIV
jgi:hypothetical protein